MFVPALPALALGAGAGAFGVGAETAATGLDCDGAMLIIWGRDMLLMEEPPLPVVDVLEKLLAARRAISQLSDPNGLTVSFKSTAKTSSTKSRSVFTSLAFGPSTSHSTSVCQCRINCSYKQGRSSKTRGP